MKEIKKSVEAHNPVLPYLTKTTKKSVSFTSVHSENKYSNQSSRTVMEIPPL